MRGGELRGGKNLVPWSQETQERAKIAEENPQNGTRLRKGEGGPKQDKKTHRC